MAIESPRDANSVVAMVGTYNGAAIPCKIDHVTGALRVVFLNATLNAPVVSPQNGVKDDNNVTSITGSYNGVAKPAFIDHATGYLKVVNS